MVVAPTVVITDSNLGSDADEQVLLAAGATVVRLQATSESELVAALAAADPDALVVQWAQISGAVLDAAPRCRFVSRLGIGYDMIDVAAATERGVAVANTPDYCVDEVVSHTLAMALWLLRGLGRFDAAVRDAQWSATAPWPLACRPSAATVGVVGLGRIGSRVARQAAALGFQVLACDPYAEAPPGVPLLPLDELLRRSDLVTLHTPLTDETRHLVRAETLALMRSGALLVNTCRGGLVDEAALVKALNEQQISGAALDVFEHEPLPAASPLRTAANVLLSPHAAWYSQASLAQLPVQAAQQVVDFLAGRPVASIVNPDYAENGRALTAGAGSPG
jgi:D-3-phosphoglycerate dehydrogenase